MSKSKHREPSTELQQAALSHYQSANYQQAASTARALIRRYPEHGFGWRLLGASLQGLGQHEQALQVTQHAVFLRPSDVQALSNLGDALGKCHRSLQAIPVLRRAISIDPRHALAQMNLGVALLDCGFAMEAIAVLREAKMLAPDNLQIKCNLGLALLKLGNRTEAAHYFLDVLRVSPDHLDATFAYGTVCHQDGQLPQAIAFYRKALALRLLQPTQVLAQPHRVSFSSPQNETLMWQALAQLATAGVHAFATAGTLLGLQREGRLLPFDKDIDFGLPFAEHDRARVCLLKQGWQENTQRYGLINPRAYQHIATGLSLDLFGYTVDAGTGITLGGLWLKEGPTGWSRVTENPTIHLTSVPGPHGVVWALADPRGWLETMYGDWRTPDPDFDTVIAAKNLRGFSLLTQCYAFNRIFQHWNNGNLKKALSTTRHSLRHLPDDALLLQAERHLVDALATTKSKKHKDQGVPMNPAFDSMGTALEGPMAR
ncbi:MAG: tetratricopeptide repeat protein [Burkholderiaceae bacterium]|nr:tetratricopeptide repeat protein [Burkholderiaceae bacterium]